MDVDIGPGREGDIGGGRTVFFGGETPADGVPLVQPLHSPTTRGHGTQHVDTDEVEQSENPGKSIGAAPALLLMTGRRVCLSGNCR
jgi:hypothetical protein